MELLDKYKYQLVGALLGLILVSLMMTIGFFKTLLLIVVVVLGAYIGSLFKDSGILENLINKLK